MAFVKLTTGHIQPVSAEKAAKIWNILLGDEKPADEAQKAFMDQVEDVYMNAKNPETPLSYLAQKSHIHEAMEPQQPMRLPDFAERRAGEHKEEL